MTTQTPDERRTASRTILIGLATLLFTIVAAAAGWRYFGGHWFIVETPSMGEAAPVGTLIFTEHTTVAQLHVGDIVTYRPPLSTPETFTHRIISLSAGSFRTKGDNNGAIDPWTLGNDNLIGRVVSRWWGFGWLVKALPLLLIGWVVVGLIGKLWINAKNRLAFNIFVGSIVFSAVGLIIKPYVRVQEVIAVPHGDGILATLVSTGLLPITVSSNVDHLNLVAGQIGTVQANRVLREIGYPLTVNVHLTWPWWIVLIIVFLSPMLWVLIVGASPIENQPPKRSSHHHRHHQHHGVLVGAIIASVTAGALTSTTAAAFAAELSNTANSVGTNAYFTCTGAQTQTSPATAYFIWPMNETSNTLPAADISGNNRSGTYSGSVTPDPTAKPCARDNSGAMAFGALGIASSNSPFEAAPTTFTESIRFKTTVGGRLIGFGNSYASSSTVYDRQMWVTDSGQVAFGIFNSGMNEAVSPLSYNDNLWHQATASLSSKGMRLYVDGELVATNAATAGAATNSTEYINLRSASTFAVLGSAVTSTGITTVNGDLGTTTTPSATGFPPSVVTGSSHFDDSAAAMAKADTQLAYNEVAALAPAIGFSGDQNGATFSPGVYSTAAAFALTGTMTLDAHGDANAVFVFQITGAMNTAAGSQVVLINGAQARNVYWQAVGAVGTGANSTMVGTILGNAALTLGEGSTLSGRALAVGAVTLADNVISRPATSTAVTSGWFRVGYDTLSGWPNQPTSSSFDGTLAFAALYLSELTANQIKVGFLAGS